MTVEFGHYTTITGLMGILGKEKLWATNIKFLNDEHEFQHALDLIKELLPTSRIAKENPGNRTHGQYLDYIQRKLNSLDSARADAVFTLSFSQEIDLLSQWRGYCPANNGYCVVFDAARLFEAIKEAYDNCHFVKCVYDLEEKRSQLRKLLNEGWDKFAAIAEDKKKERQSVVDDLSKQILLLASYFKHPSFAEEKEHRIVIILEHAPDHAELQFREGRFSLVPFIELSASRSLVTKIVIGPTAHKALSLRSLEAFLEKCFNEISFLIGVRILHSETPYRSW